MAFTELAVLIVVLLASILYMLDFTKVDLFLEVIKFGGHFGALLLKE